MASPKTLTFDFVDALMEVIGAAAQKRVKIKHLRMENNLRMLKRVVGEIEQSILGGLESRPGYYEIIQESLI